MRRDPDPDPQERKGVFSCYFSENPNCVVLCNAYMPPPEQSICESLKTEGGRLKLREW